jgi:hypothetical protein
MMKVKDTKVQVNVKPLPPIDTNILEDLSDKFSGFGKALANATLPLSQAGTYAANAAARREYEQLADISDELQAVTNAYTPPLDLKWQQPSNMPIALRMEYQRQLWMRPIWWVQDLWDRIRGNDKP